MANATVEKLKNLGLRHGEKLAVTLASVVFVSCIGLAASTKTIQTTPEQLKTAADASDQNLSRRIPPEQLEENIEKAGIVETNFAKEVEEQSKSLLVADDYRPERPWVMPEPGAGYIRDTPKLIAVTELYAYPGRGGTLTYAQMMTPAGLKDIAAYADGIGPELRSIIPLDAKGALGTPTALVRDAHAAGLMVIPYTFRPENHFQPSNLRKGADNARNVEGSIADAPLRISATCTRAGVLEAHTESVTVSLKRAASEFEVIRAFEGFGRDFTSLGLPNSPRHMITVHRDPTRPQPRLDRDLERGMTTSVGRIRADEVMPNGWKYLLVSHNSEMGAGRGAVLLAEYLLHAG